MRSALRNAIHPVRFHRHLCEYHLIYYLWDTDSTAMEIDDLSEASLARLARIHRNVRNTKGYVNQRRDASTRDASELYISKPNLKLGREGTYVIGGTRTEARPDFWFHFTTSCCGQTNLLNLFVRVSWPGRYIIKYVRDNKLRIKVDRSRDRLVAVGYGALKERTFKTQRDNEQVYLMTYQFDAVENFGFCQALVIPFAVKVTVPIRLLNYYSRRLIDTKLETADFTIISDTNLKHRIHAELLKENSPKLLKNIVNAALFNSKSCIRLDICDHDMLALTEFIYIHEIYTTVEFLDIVKLVSKFKLTKMYLWVLGNLRKFICYANAYELARIAAQNAWTDVFQVLFEYMKHSPEMLHAFGTKDEVDMKIFKTLLSHLFSECSLKNNDVP